MGISLDLYRCRVGLFNLRSQSFKGSPQGGSLLMRSLGISLRHVPLAVLCMLLLISGVEPNPGPVIICKYCQNTYNDASQYLSHVILHRFRRNFKIPCCFLLCSREFVSMQSFRSHLSRFHREARTRPQVLTPKAVLCPICKESLVSRDQFSKHMCLHLSNGISFKCPFCKADQSEKRKFQRHMSRYHPAENNDFFCKNIGVESSSHVDPPLDEPDQSDCDVEVNENDDQVFNNDLGFGDADISNTAFNNPDFDPYPEAAIKEEVARFYLKLEGEHTLPTSIVQEISKEIKLLSQLSHYRLKRALKEQLVAVGMDETTMKDIISVTFKKDPIFNVHHKDEDIEHLGTDHLRSKFWRSRYPYVEPKEIYLGVDEHGKKKLAHYVPIRESLNILLKDEKIKHMVVESFSRESKDGIFEDYTDGEAFKKHKCIHNGGKCLQIHMCQDAYDFNPFSASSGVHKPLGFYYTLGNMRPEYRSMVDLIMLVYVILEKHTKPSQNQELKDEDVLKACLKPLLDELDELQRNGIDIDGENIPVCLQFLLGDDLGQHIVGGFVKSFTSQYVCRYCHMPTKDFKAKPYIVQRLRKPTEYDEAVRMAKDMWIRRRDKILKQVSRKANQQANKVASRCSAPGKKTLMKRTISKSAFNKLCSINFKGVKYRPSPFNSDRLNFHVCSPAMPPCLAHDIFEGILKCVLPCILRYCIKEKKWFDLVTLNRRIKTFKCFGTDARDTPKPLKSLEKLSGNAVQNWNFLRLIPLIIRDLIQDPEDEVWQIHLRLVEITQYVCAPKISILQVAYLKDKISLYLATLKRLEKHFPKCLIPKQHFLCHYPDLISIFGPLIRLFTLRYESKHSFFKRVARMSHNFINITYTLSKKYMCRFGYDHSSGLLPQDVIYDPSTSSYLNLNSLSENEREVFPEDFLSEDFEVIDTVEVHGIQYKNGLNLILRPMEDSSSLLIGTISRIFLSSSNIVSFLFETKEAMNSFNGYYSLQQSLPKCYEYHCLKDLVDYYPLPSYRFQDQECIVLKHSVVGM